MGKVTAILDCNIQLLYELWYMNQIVAVVEVRIC
jgi:hypothetical protein